ncbi:MAG: hypothetical protein ACR2PL_03640 [Dehalococcoidia bacterium]
MTGPTARLRSGWAPAAIVSGFVGAVVSLVVVLLVYGLAAAIGDGIGIMPGPWFSGLERNSMLQTVRDAAAIALLVHIGLSLGWALLYATMGEPWLTGPGWRRGLQLSVLPWLVSLVVFFPAFGGGLLGFGLGAGPLPMLGSLLLHAVFGAVVGHVYMRADAVHVSNDGWSATDSGEEAEAERGLAIGILGGGALGLLLGLSVSATLSLTGMALVGAVVPVALGLALGSSMGALLGSFAGLTAPSHPS